MPKLTSYDLSNLRENPCNLAYLAGFIDGEGCFYIGNFRTVSQPTGNTYRNYHCILKISNNHLDVLKQIVQYCGGAGRIDSSCKTHDRNHVTHTLWFTGNCLTELTELLIPYLIVKKAQAEIMLKMRQTFPTSGSRGRIRPPPEVEELRAVYHRELHRLNSRFKLHPLKEDLYKHLAPCCPSA